VLVRETARKMAVAMSAMKATGAPWLPGYRIQVLDGNCIEANQHRPGMLQAATGGAAGQVAGPL